MSKDTFDIWQLKHNSSAAYLLFMGSRYLEDKGIPVDLSNYELKYHTELKASDTLDRIYERFNLDRPEDFHGHSLSVSDLIVVHRAMGTSVFYVDTFGFKDVTNEAKSIEAVMGEQEKPSIRQRLKASKEQTEKQATQKSQEKNRSGVEL
ncbi:MAG: hypothetical protein IJ049_04610 [Oscillospiraceae bacterium]|nr:hypothetical protein [Oscillospiraceae bacterium]